MKLTAKLILVVLFSIFAKESFSFSEGQSKQQYSETPNDFVIEQIKRLHRSPAEVTKELKLALESETSQARKAELLYLIALSNLKSGTYDNAVSFVHEGLQIATSEDYPLMHNRLILAKSHILEMQGNPGAALALIDGVANWARINNVTQLRIGALMTAGVLNSKLGFYKSAFTILKQAYDLSNEVKTQVNPSHLAGLLGKVLVKQGQGEDSIPYLDEWLEFARKSNNRILEIRALLALGDGLSVAERFDEAATLYDMAKKASKAQDDQYSIAKSYASLGNVSVSRKRYDDAERYYKESISRLPGFDDKYFEFDTYLGLARLYLEQEKYKESRAILEEACSIAKNLYADQLLMQCASLSADLLYSTANYSAAYNELKKSIDLKIKYGDEQNTFAMATLREQLNLARNEAELGRLKQENEVQRAQLDLENKSQIILVLLAIMLIFFSVGLLIYHFKRQKYLQSLELVINFDALTSLHSRRYIIDTLKRFIDSALDNQKVCTIAMLDLDFFKSINDKYGHGVGDEVLIHFGELAKKIFSDNAIIGRLGGEEFLFIFPAMSIDQCEVKLASFQNQLAVSSSEISGLNDGHRVTFSAGIADVMKGDCIEEALSIVDRVLFLAKDNGRNCIEVKKREGASFNDVTKITGPLQTL